MRISVDPTKQTRKTFHSRIRLFAAHPLLFGRDDFSAYIHQHSGSEFMIEMQANRRRVARNELQTPHRLAEHPDLPAPGAIITGGVSLSVRLDHAPA